MRRNGMTQNEIAEEMMVSKAAVSQAFDRIKAKGVSVERSARTGRPRLYDYDDFWKMVQQGLSNRQIRERTGLSSQQVSLLKNKLKKKYGDPAAQGFAGSASDLLAFGGGPRHLGIWEHLKRQVRMRRS